MKDCEGHKNKGFYLVCFIFAHYKKRLYAKYIFIAALSKHIYLLKTISKITGDSLKK